MKRCTVTTAVADFVSSAALTAETVIVPEGIAFGALYSPLAEIVPSVAFPPATLFTIHVTFVFVAFETEATNCAV